jgi:hypothetical protein
MRRSDFLAIIPSLSAIPFIGKEIIKKSDRIEIFQPEQMEHEISTKDYCEFQIVKNGRVLASGYVDSIEANRPEIETTCKDNYGARTFAYGSWECRVTGLINGPLTHETLSEMHNIYPPINKIIHSNLTQGVCKSLRS